MNTYKCYKPINQESEDAIEIEALDEIIAVEKFAKMCDINSGKVPTAKQDVMVKQDGTDYYQRYTVYVNPMPNYSAVKATYPHNGEFFFILRARDLNEASTLAEILNNNGYNAFERRHLEEDLPEWCVHVYFKNNVVEL